MILRVVLILALPLLLRFWGIFGSQPAPEDWVRRGNAAFEQGNFAEAAADYAKAEVHITDPGLTAFNKAAALYEKGLYRDAERHYRCALEDAAGKRRRCALFGLANSLLQQGHVRGPSVLREAIRCYEDCLNSSGMERDLAEDCRHNLELAKLLLYQAQARSSDRPEKQPGEDRQRPPDRQGLESPAEQTSDGKADAKGERRPVHAEQKKAGQRTEEGRPGAGTELPPVPDQDEMAPMSREDAEQHLQRAAERILSEQQSYRQQHRRRPINNSGLDW
jgi:tetratricopeptide (TPR) repeat protein